MAENPFAAALGPVENFFDGLFHEVFGGAGAGSGGGPGSQDIRWEGMSNAQLAHAVQLLGQGPGAAGVTAAADALSSVATALAQIDSTLHDQLQAIGVDWQSQAAGLAQEMTTAAAAYSQEAGQAGGGNSSQVGQQADAFAAAKNAAPEPSTLNGPAQTNFFDRLGQTLTGHETDHAQQVGRTNVARQQAIDTLNTYSGSTQTGLSGYQPLPQPPGYTVTPSAVDTSIGQTTTVSGYVPPSAGAPGGGGFAGPVGSSSGVTPGLPGLAAAAGPVAGGGLPGAVPGSPGLPGGGPGFVGGGGLPGVGAPGQGGGLPGLPPSTGGPLGGGPGVGGPGVPAPTTGVGPGAGNLPGLSTPGPAAAAGAGSLIEDAAIGSAIVGGTTGAGVAGASARPDRLVRTRDLAGFGPATEEDLGARGQAARALAELDAEEAAAAEANARIGATAEPPSSMLEPAVGGTRGEDDAERVSRYAVESEDVFGDDRMVVPPVLGGEPDVGPETGGPSTGSGPR